MKEKINNQMNKDKHTPDNRIYILQKDLPDAKAGTELVFDGDNCYDYNSDRTDETDNVTVSWYKKDFVENNPEWFKLKQQPVVSSKIEVAGIWRAVSATQQERYDFYTSKPISEEKYESVKKAISDCLNNENDIVGLLRDCVSETWGSLSFDKTQKDFEKFLEKRGLWKKEVKDTIRQYPLTEEESIPTLDRQEGYKKFLKENNLCFSKETLDAMMKNVWNAAREVKQEIKNQFTLDLSVFVHNTFNHYRNSLPENIPTLAHQNKVQEKILFETTLNMKVTSDKQKCFINGIPIEFVNIK